MENVEDAPPAWAKAVLDSVSKNMTSLGSMIKSNEELIKKSSADMAASVEQLGKRMDALEKANGGFFLYKVFL